MSESCLEPLVTYRAVYRCPLCRKQLGIQMTDEGDYFSCVPLCGYWYDARSHKGGIDRVTGLNAEERAYRAVMRERRERYA